MRYRIKKKNVLVRQGKKWKVLKKCLSKRDAIQLLRELEAIDEKAKSG
jgi:hypothetical protein